MDTIWQAAYGVDIDIQNNHENFYYSQSEKIFRDAGNFTFAHYFASRFFLNLFDLIL